MTQYIDTFFFGIYPYIALTIFLLGSLIRFDRDQYTWKSDSSEMLKRKSLRLGSNLFHVGIIALFFSHLFGLLTPPSVYKTFGLTTEAKQMMAIVGGAVLGLMCLIGLVILIYRRWTEPRIAANTRFSDWVTLWWILLVLIVGLLSIVSSLQHTDGAAMVQLGEWARRIVTFRSGAVGSLQGVPFIYKLHMALGMTLFVIFPFTRLVHVWSGFASVSYLGRAWQIVRPR